MAVLSIKLKAIETDQVKDQIENAHKVFNDNVKIFEQFLLLIQQKDYYYLDENGEEQYKSADEVRKELKNYLEKLGNVTNIEKCMDSLGKLQEVIRDKGSNATGMLAKLYKVDSSAGTNSIRKIVDPVPEWVNYFNVGSSSFIDPIYKQMADEWIVSEIGQVAIAPIIEGSGRPSAFKKAYSEGKAWYAAFVKDQIKYRKDVEDGLARLLSELDVCGALPIIHIEESLINTYPVWVKLFLKTALENYASYLACDEMTRNNYAKIKAEYQKNLDFISEKYNAEYDLLDAFLKTAYSEEGHQVYLTRRMCRGLDDIRKEWKKCDSVDERVAVLNTYQADAQGIKKIGDVNFLRWLAEESNICIVNNNCIDSLLKYYESLKRLENAKKCASYTVANAIESKRYLFYENPKGSNYKKYRIDKRNGDLYVRIPLLLKNDECVYIEKDVELKLAHSRQFQAPYDEDGNKLDSVQLIGKDGVRFTNNKKMLENGIIKEESFDGTMGGMDLRPEFNGNGVLSDAYLSFTITVDDKCRKEDRKFSQIVYSNFSSAYDGKHKKELEGQNIRALSVDLGLKQLGAVVVGNYKIDGSNDDISDVMIDRMFLLRLDGETCSAKITEKRSEALREIRNLRGEINYLSFLRQIYHQDRDEKRIKLIKRRLLYTSRQDRCTALNYYMTGNNWSDVKASIASEYKSVMDEMNVKMKQFRSESITSKQKREYEPGKSYWAISYLEELRKLLMSWSSLSYNISEENRKMSLRYGVTATRLLEHINNLKDDRIKSGADALIQAALGYVYDNQNLCWIKKYESCHVIIFEDLSRYNFKLDRPKAENSKLMKWSHRALVEEVTRQADIYGISVYDSTDAAYTSKFHYFTGAPGIRCDRLGKDAFSSDGILKEYVYDKLPERLKRISNQLKIGDLVPSEIGSVFVTLNEDHHITMLNADMNAACNLQERFWHRHTHLMRVSTENVGGCLRIKGTDAESGGKRVRGKFINEFGTANVILKKADTEGHFNIVKKERGSEHPYVGRELVYNLFRDQSGLFFDKNEWIGTKEFWNTVQDRLTDELIALIDV